MALYDIVIPEGDCQNGIIEIHTTLSMSPSDITTNDDGVIEIPAKNGTSSGQATCFAF